MLDEDLVDLSDFYLRAISALEAETHGRENVFPVLFGEANSEIVAETYDDAMDALEEADTTLDETQIDAIAKALASSPFHLIQGPPGTGKTFTLARLVERLVLENHRILVTGFTHRSIHNALKKIHQLLDGLCPVVQISAPVQSTEEADHVAQIVHELLTSGISPEEIGVVTPFRAQASRIRTLLRGDRFKVRFPNIWKMITVDTVERFQGQEREVILYSFASSDPAFIRKLGNFLLQPARLNVAVTQGFLKRRQSWLASGIVIRGRSRQLQRAYRNSRSILRFARAFCSMRGINPADNIDFNLPAEEQIAAIPVQGNPPEMVLCPDVQALHQRAINELLTSY